MRWLGVALGGALLIGIARGAVRGRRSCGRRGWTDGSSLAHLPAQHALALVARWLLASAGEPPSTCRELTLSSRLPPAAFFVGSLEEGQAHGRATEVPR